ncbi:MAG: hypothetical protein K9G49_04955 [Taibaiella sp.]|nr:hypothetical protein [Taibaiella sp.]
MKTVKLIAASLLIAASIGNHAYAGEKGKKMKKHKCTETCHKDGKCTMAHGEKGHSCIDACKKASDKKM